MSGASGGREFIHFGSKPREHRDDKDEEAKDEYGQLIAQSATNLAFFITKNKSLLHLDLSYMSLSKDEVLEICTACSKARTLLSIHLTGNGATQSQYAEVTQNPHVTEGDDDYFRNQSTKVQFRN